LNLKNKKKEVKKKIKKKNKKETWNDIYHIKYQFLAPLAPAAGAAKNKLEEIKL
jgi:hypothetical protein